MTQIEGFAAARAHHIKQTLALTFAGICLVTVIVSGAVAYYAHCQVLSIWQTVHTNWANNCPWGTNFPLLADINAWAAIGWKSLGCSIGAAVLGIALAAIAIYQKIKKDGSVTLFNRKIYQANNNNLI
jgi:hypothetical protein